MTDTRALDIKVSMNQAQLNADIRTAKGLVSTFTSEVRRSDAELKAFGKTSDGLGQKKESLTKKFQAQEKQMELLNKAYEEQIKAGNDTSKQTLKLERDINTLAGQMAKTESEIDKVTDELNDYTDVAGQAGTSTVDLYNKIGEADQQLRTYESELKKANSEVKVFGETSDTLGNKLAALNNVYDSQQSKMEALQTAYEREVEKSGAASDAAQKLAQEMNTLEAAMNNTQSEMNETSEGLQKIADTSPNTAEQLDSVRDSLSALVMDKVIGYLDTVADKLLEIGTNAVLASADWEAHGSLFEQVFKNMSDGAERGVNRIQDAYGQIDEIAEYSGRISTSLEEGFIKSAQQYMSLGLDSGKVMELTTRTMKASTDAAAAYNTEMDDAQHLIQSFIQGNTRAGRSLGIFGSDAQLAAFAMKEGYIDISEAQNQFFIDSEIKVGKAQQNYDKVMANSKSTAVDVADAQNKLTKALKEQEEGLQVSQKAWTDLDDSLKQEARLKYIEEVYDMSNVTGQAKNEADEWETTINNLEEAQRQLNIAIGESALEMLIPVIQNITALMIKFVEWYGELEPAVRKLITFFGLFLIVAGKVAVLFGKLKVVAGLLNVNMAKLIKTIVIFGGKFLIIAAIIGLVVYAIMQSETAMTWLRNAWEATSAFLVNTWESILDVANSVWSRITEWIIDNQETIKAAIENVWGVILAVVDTVLAVLVPMFKGAFLGIRFAVGGAMKYLWTIISSMLKIILGVVEVFLSVLAGDWEGAWNNIKELTATIVQAIVDVVVGAWKYIVDVVTGIMLFLGAVVFGVLNGIYTLWMHIWSNIKDFVIEIFTFISNFISTGLEMLFGAMSKWLGDIAARWSEGWEEVKTILSAVWIVIVAAANTKAEEMYQAIVDWLTSLGTWWTTFWEGIKEFFSGIWTSVKEMLESIKTPIDNVIGYFQGLWESIKSVFEGIKTTINDAWESVKGTLSKLNPANLFNAQHVVKVAYDSDPYNPAIGDFNIPTQPVPIFSSAIGSLMAASNYITGGLNSAFNNLNGIYEGGAAVVVIPQEKDDRYQAVMNDRLDTIERLLTIIAEKELHAFLDSREVTSKLYNPMRNETQLRDVETSRTTGTW